MKFRLVRVELFLEDERTGGRTDGKTDMTKLIITFRSFSDTSEIGYFVYDAT